MSVVEALSIFPYATSGLGKAALKAKATEVFESQIKDFNVNLDSLHNDGSLSAHVTKYFKTPFAFHFCLNTIYNAYDTSRLSKIAVSSALSMLCQDPVAIYTRFFMATGVKPAISVIEQVCKKLNSITITKKDLYRTTIDLFEDSKGNFIEDAAALEKALDKENTLVERLETAGIDVAKYREFVKHIFQCTIVADSAPQAGAGSPLLPTVPSSFIGVVPKDLGLTGFAEHLFRSFTFECPSEELSSYLKYYLVNEELPSDFAEEQTYEFLKIASRYQIESLVTLLNEKLRAADLSSEETLLLYENYSSVPSNMLDDETLRLFENKLTESWLKGEIELSEDLVKKIQYFSYFDPMNAECFAKLLQCKNVVSVAVKGLSQEQINQMSTGLGELIDLSVSSGTFVDVPPELQERLIRVYFTRCEALTSLIAPLATTVNCSGCEALTSLTCPTEAKVMHLNDNCTRRSSSPSYLVMLTKKLSLLFSYMLKLLDFLNPLRRL